MLQQQCYRHGTAEMPPVRSQLEILRAVRVGGRAENVRWPVRERCGSGREGSLNGEGTTGWAHPAHTGPSACAVIHSCRDAFGNHPRVQILAVSTVVTHQNSSSSPAPLARWAGHMPLSRPSHLRSHVSARILHAAYVSFGLCASDPSACCQRGQELLHAGESDRSSLGPRSLGMMHVGFALTSAVTLAILRPKHDRNNALSSRLQLARLHRDLPDHPPRDPAFYTVKSATSGQIFKSLFQY